MIVIGVTGFRRSGKNSTTNILKRYGFREYGFADALRLMALAVDPLIDLAATPQPIRERLGAFDPAGWGTAMRYSHILTGIGYEAGKEIPDLRRYLQKLGTEGVRNVFGPRAWVEALARRIEQDQPERVAISDVRFHSEAEWLLSLPGAQLWRVTRPGFGGDDPHPSERDIPNLPASVDIVATTLSELEREVIAVLSNVRYFNQTELHSQDRDHESHTAPGTASDSKTTSSANTGSQPQSSPDARPGDGTGSVARAEDRSPA